MKTRPLIGIFASLAVITLCFAAGPPGKDRPPKIESCIQFPGTHVAQPNLDNIIKVLEKDREYPQNYRVRVWNNGKMARDIGQMQIKKAELSETDNYAKSSGLTSVTVRVGYCDVRASSETDHHFEDADGLVRELGPLLPKYNK
jgi:hypothetical protein